MDYGEGIPHFANKVVMWKRLDNLRKRSEDFYIFYDHEDRRYMSAVLNGVTEALIEGEFGWAKKAPYRADVLLERGKEPLSAIEITHTSEPSGDKLREAARLGIDVYEIEGGQPPFSKPGLKVLKAHIAPRNWKAHQQFTQRMIDLYAEIANPSNPDAGFIRVVKNWRGHLDQHDAAKREELEDWMRKSNVISNAIRQGLVFCERCRKQIPVDGDYGIHLERRFVHFPNGGCRYVPVCEQCETELKGWPFGELPSDAAEWNGREDCGECQDASQRNADAIAKMLTKGPFGYVVNGRTVSRGDFLGLCTLMKLAAVQGAEVLEAAGISALRIAEFRYCTHEGIEAIVQAAYSGADASKDSNTSLRPAGLFGGSMPPCPLSPMLGG